MLGYYNNLEKLKKNADIYTFDFDEIEYIDYSTPPHNVLTFEGQSNRDIDETFITKRANRCLNKKIAISLDGHIKPCPAWNEALVDIDKFDDLFVNNIIDNYWNLTRDSIDDCSSCSLKWLCNNCYIALMKASKKGLGGSYVCRKKQ